MMINSAKYNMNRMLLDFDPEIITEGAEWILSEEPSIRKIKGYENDKFHSVRNNGVRGKRSQEQITEENDMICYQIESGSRSQDRSAVKAELCIDERRGEFVRSWCSCSQFQRNWFCCKHIAGLGFKYLQEQGEPLEGSIIEQKLTESTGVDHPMIPGKLRMTSSELGPLMTQLMRSVPVSGKTAWETGEKKAAPEKLRMEVFASPINDTLAIELRIGTKRAYQIKDLEHFLNAYSSNQMYSFSSTLYLPAGRENFDADDQQLLDYLCRLKDARKRKGDRNISGYYYDSYSFHYDAYNQPYVSLNTSQQARLILLQNQDLDQFMQIMDGKTITYSDMQSKNLTCEIHLDREPQPLQVKKKEFGATMRMNREELIACGFDKMYLRVNEEILSLPAEQWEMRKNIRMAFRGKTELYVQDRDLPSLVTALYEVSGESQRRILAPLAPAMTGMEKPQIRIYLDYPQQNMITCRIRAAYPTSGRDYDLFSRKEEASLRNLSYEQTVGEQVWAYFDAWNQDTGELAAECEDDRLYRFLTETIPALAGYGEVLISDQLKKLKNISRPVLNVGIAVDSGSLLMSLRSNELSKEEIIEVLSSYNRKKIYTRLKNGSFISYEETDASVLEALAESFRAYGKKNPEAMKIPLFRALYIEELLKDRENVNLEEANNYRELLRQLKNEDTQHYQVPESLAETLRPYQIDGYRWMRMLKDNGFGGILADDMGLGKTLQVIAFLLAEKTEKAALAPAPESQPASPALIIAPASLVYNWQKEIRTFTPQLSCKVLAGSAKERKALLAQLKLSQDAHNTTETADSNSPAIADVYITSYDLLKRDIKEYEGIHFANQIIDEAQFIKNQGTQTAKTVRLIDSSFRMALTGTPIENRLSELWSIFDYIMPGFLYNYTRFREDYESPVIINHDREVMERLRQMVHPFILRRLKKDVLQDLPDKLEENITILLEGEQRKVYDAYAKRLRLYLDKQSDEEYHRSKLEILAELTHLRQICCGPELFLENYKGKNAKLEACIELVQRAIDSGHKLLIFSQFTKVLDQMGERLKEEAISYYRIDGSTPKEERMMLVEAFQQETDTVPVFCISLKAGGTGLNLTAADIVIHYDPWWNIAAQNQATDRTHRIGQQKVVTVYSLIAEDTIEEQITLLQKTKAKLAEDILSGEGISSIMIHKEDLLALLRN